MFFLSICDKISVVCNAKLSAKRFLLINCFLFVFRLTYLGIYLIIISKFSFRMTLIIDIGKVNTTFF